jgi:hypothetical protein
MTDTGRSDSNAEVRILPPAFAQTSPFGGDSMWVQLLPFVLIFRELWDGPRWIRRAAERILKRTALEMPRHRGRVSIAEPENDTQTTAGSSDWSSF